MCGGAAGAECCLELVGGEGLLGAQAQAQQDRDRDEAAATGDGINKTGHQAGGKQDRELPVLNHAATVN